MIPTAAVRGSKPDLGMWDFVMDKSGAGAGFLRELRFPLPIYIPSALPIIFTITRGWHNRPGVAAVPIVSQTKKKKPITLYSYDIRISFKRLGFTTTWSIG
jgi:hypothetical protein